MTPPRTKEEALRALEQMKAAIPKQRREIVDILRMIDLARQSPRASLNTDFIDRVAQTWEMRKMDVERNEALVKQLEQFMTLPPSPPTPPKTPPDDVA